MHGTFTRSLGKNVRHVFLIAIWILKHIYLRSDGGVALINAFLGVWVCSLYGPWYSAKYPLRISGSMFPIP
jgi:hypothetical protein